MKKQIIIHVGSVKTGSSYLQRLFSMNRESLKAGGISYPAYRECGERFANGNMLRDRASASDVQALVESDDCRTILFSEEGLFVGFLSAIPTYFWDHDVKVVAYIRDPVEVIAAWAAEFSKPYNAAQGEIYDIEKNVSILCQRYGEEMQGFLGCVDYAGVDNVIIRPYARSILYNGALEEDFLHAIGRDDINQLIATRIEEAVNPTFSRKYCDISATLYSILQTADRLYEYDERLVSAINRNCKSGDERSVVDTLYSKAPDIVKKLSWIDVELGKRLAWNTEAYTNQKFRMDIYNEPVNQINRHEVEYHLLRISVARNISSRIGFDPYSPCLSDQDISSGIDEVLRYLENKYDELLRQRSELLKMRRLVVA